MSNMMTQPRNFALCGCWGRLPSQDTVESTRLLMDYSKVVLIKIYVIKVMLQFTDSTCPVIHSSCSSQMYCTFCYH